MLQVRAPAEWTDCLACAGARALARKAAIWMRSNGDSVAMLDAAGALLAVAYLVTDATGAREFCLSIRPDARAHMLALARLAHSTLARLADDGGVVFCHVNEGNRSGARMARLTGFRHEAGTRWIFASEGVRHAGGQRTFRRGRRRRGTEGGGCLAGGAAGGERSPTGGGPDE